MWIAEAFRPNHCWESGGERWRLWIGDMAWWNENEGGYRAGAQISFDAGIGDHIGDYDELQYGENYEKSKYYLTHSFSFMLWRWGFSINVRGRQIPRSWDTPRWQLDRHGELLPDYR